MSDSKTFRITEEKRRVLLVEDEYVNQQILLETLGTEYDVLVTESGEEALEIIRTQHETLSIVLLDLNLPGINGLEVLSRIKGNPASARIPVIVMTSDSEAEVQCLSLGAIDFIPKPYPASKIILARILRIVELSEDRETLRLTERDQLTGLYNKDFFYHYATLLDSFHKDTPTDAIVFDINHFHTINDRYGKARGNEILCHIAREALDYVHASGGIVCRLSADTFMLYCTHISNYEDLLSRLSVALDEESAAQNRVRLRMGVYPNADRSIDIERRFDRAKMAADSVKENLTNPIGFYDHSMHEAEILSEQLIDDFEKALRERQFLVYYQPKFDIRKDEPALSSAEALVRWNHPTFGMVSPATFIPLFEKNGLIQALDRYVWSTAAAQIRDWKDRLHVSVPVSINVSRVDLYDPKLKDCLMTILSDNGLSPADLYLEITESAYTDKPEQIIDMVNGLRDLGFKIEMDDFGTGYSSLSMLLTVPVDVLKLDTQFTRHAFKGQKDTRLLEVVIQLARSFRVPTIAEGVETAEQFQELKELGYDIIQGYYFSRPLPAAEFEKLIPKK